MTTAINYIPDAERLRGYASAADILDAIRRANPYDAELSAGQCDGTYRIVGSWVGSARVWMAERITEDSGWEVAYTSAEGGTDLNAIHEGDRWGLWVDGGVIYLDRTVHVTGAPGGVALDLARLYAQEAIWDWARGTVVPTTDPTTAL